MAYIAAEYWAYDYVIEDQPPVTDDIRVGGWLPVVYLDKQGKPVSLEAKVAEVAIAAIDEVKPDLPKRQRIEANAMRRDLIRADVEAGYREMIDGFLAKMAEMDAILLDTVKAAMMAAERDAIEEETILLLSM